MADSASDSSDNPASPLLPEGLPSAPVRNGLTWNGENRQTTGNHAWLAEPTTIDFTSEADIPVSSSLPRETTTATRIPEYDTRDFHSINNNGVRLLWDAVVHQRLDEAKQLLVSARDLGQFVEISNGFCPTLDKAIEKGSVAVAKFILDYLAEKHLSVDASCAVLTNYLIPLIEKFPNLMAEYLKKDRFSFEYGRFTVPCTLFEKNGRRPVAMTTDVALADWTMMDSATARDFWVYNSEEHAAELTETSDLQVEVCAKFFCIDQQSVRKHSSAKIVRTPSKPKAMFGWNHILWMLSKSNLPVDVFTSESVKTFINWMFYSLYNRFLFLLIVDVLTAGLFSFFAVSYGSRADKSNWLHGTFLSFPEDEWLSRVLIILSFALPLITLTIRDSMMKIIIVMISFFITVHAFQYDQQGQFSAFLTSINCILFWLLVVEDLLPFDRIGPFVSMAKYSIKEVLPFTILGASVLVGFSFAFQALPIQHHEDNNNGTGATLMTNRGGSSACAGGGDNGDDDDDDQDFNSFFHVLKLLFQAAIGNFEEKAFRSTGTFVGKWRSLLFNGFIFVGGVVLLSLLIAILSETYTRVRSTEKEELVKCRADMAGATFRCIAHRLFYAEKRSRTHGGDRDFERRVSERFQARTNRLFYKFRLRRLDRHKYFHYLVRTMKTDEERSKAGSNDVPNQIADLSECLQQFQESIQTAQAQNNPSSQETIQNVQTQIHHLDERMKMMEINIARVLEKLDQLTAHTA